MRVLVGCEMSGVVRRAFRDAGHDAWSCDLMPASDGSEYHIQGSVLDVLGDGWDLGIFHPPCTYLCNSGVCHLSKGGELNRARHSLMMAGCDLFAACYHAPIKHVAVENPIMHKYAKDYLISAWKVPSFTQSIQPYEHGHGETKRTCLWIRNLTLIKPSNPVEGRKPVLHYLPPGPDRARLRSKTYEGIAKALAAQWSNL